MSGTRKLGIGSFRPVVKGGGGGARGCCSVRTTTGVRAAPGRGCPDGSLGVRPLRRPSAELLGQSDDDALGAADIAEPIAVLVLRQLADEFGAMGA
jgi:hypothetical protein